MVNDLFKEFAALNETDAIALGGSRAGELFDEKSDYDVYIYCTDNISEEVRKNILSKYCSKMEIGNHFWEYEDNCTLNNGIDIDILYRDLSFICEDTAAVTEQFQARNGYTTCIWHNIKTCKVIFDRNGNLAKAKERFDIPYPKELKKNIITRNSQLLYDAMPAYLFQIEKAVKRDDIISINHRTAAFMESYFDIIFAANELTHIGEKRLISYCREHCQILPKNFEENLNTLYSHLFTQKQRVPEDLRTIINELKICLNL